MKESFKDNHGARLKPEADSPLKDEIRPLAQEKIRIIYDVIKSSLQT